VEKGLFKHGNSSVLVTAFSNDHPRDAAALLLPFRVILWQDALLYAASFSFKLAK
jgi:hypothetical protein